jgi:uncharacterized protein YggU (UPF0235/DUF167 family)
VHAPAADGAATEEVLRAIAGAFGVRSSAVGLVRDATSRHKVLAIEGEATQLEHQLGQLLNAAS